MRKITLGSVFFMTILFLGLIFSFISFEEVLANGTTCQEVCDTFGGQYNVYECTDDFESDCSSYPKFDDNYCYYDCVTGFSGVFDIPDCDSNTCICIKKTSCDSSENNCYNQTGCTSCEGRRSSCENKPCCQQPDALMCDSETELCYNPSNNFHCESNRDCYSDEECMSGKCDLNGTRECECSDRGEACEEYYGASSNSQCADGRCNDDYSVCYDRDFDEPGGEICYHDLECESDSCDFDAADTAENEGRCKSADDEVDDGTVDDGTVDDGTVDDEPDDEPEALKPKPLIGSSVCNDYCFHDIEPPDGTICICNPLSADSFEDIINNIVDFIYTISLAVVPLMIVWAGVLYVTSGGNPDQITKAKNIIIYTLAGFAVVLLSKGFVVIIEQLLE